MVPLIENLGELEHRVTTTRPLAQQYFNQGLRLIYAFNHDEAIRAFQAAAKVDPTCAMAQWGIALSLGPNYNLAAEEERAAGAYKAILAAQKLVSGASPPEAAYIDALSKRYAETYQPERKPLDTAYANAMRKLAAQYPDDLDAAVLFAESLMDLRPWDLWTADGEAQPGTAEIVATLEAVLRKNEKHPGANHFYIHAVEASPEPQRGLPSALRLGALMPGAGHLVHMPSHIYFRLGRYADAVESNQRAVEVDRKYIEKYKPQGIYPMMYYPHNIHFLWAALCMEGRSADAIAAADQVVKSLDDEMIKEMPMLEYFLPTRLYTLARFHKWDEISKEKQPPAEFTFASGMWHYAQGLACAASGKPAAAKEHQRQLADIIAATPHDLLVMRHSALRLLGIAADELGATLNAQSGNTDAALAHLQDAVLLQDGLQYDEPPPWYFPMRQALAAQLLAVGRPADAETVYREDLRRNPGNGWSLRGLERALRALSRADEADRVHERFEKAWARADFKLSD
jgi:tetratricopeptide (TPR) repeat protein